GTFRVRGDVIEVFPTYDDNAYRIELFGDEVDSLSQIDPLFGTVKQKYTRLPIYPKSHYVMSAVQKNRAMETILEELSWWEKELEKEGRLVESQRVHQRTRFDLEMIKSMGYCHGLDHLQVEASALMHTLGFHQTPFFLQLFFPPGQFFENGLHGAVLLDCGHYIVALGINRQPRVFLFDRAKERIN